MEETMNSIIIGGIVAAVAGLISGVILTLWQDKRRREANEVQTTLELLEEVNSNRAFINSIREKRRSYKEFGFSTYHNCRGRLGFLDDNTRTALDRAQDAGKFLNIAMAQRRESGSQDSSFPTGELEQALEQASKGLQTWLKSQHKPSRL